MTAYPAPAPATATAFPNPGSNHDVPPATLPPVITTPLVSRRLARLVQHIAAWTQPPPVDCHFKFSLSKSSAADNFQLLYTFGLDLERAFQEAGGTCLAYGSEFKPPEILQPLLQYHPFWTNILTALSKGVQTPQAHQSEQTRRRSVTEAIARGNHKSAASQPNLLQTLLADEVRFGFSLPLPTDKAIMIPDCWLSPLGIATQSTIDDRGSIIPKFRLTHDLSWNYPSGASPNSRLLPDKLSPVTFGHCLSRILHYIVDVRCRHPKTPIYLMKVDWSKAFRRLHASAPDAAGSSCLVDDDIFLLSLRLTFGGASNPSRFSDFSQSSCDLVNALQRCPDVDPEAYLHLLPLPVPPKNPLPPTFPFGQARQLSVTLATNDFGSAENFLDDGIGIVPDLESSPHKKNQEGNNISNRVRRLSILMPLVIQLLTRPLADPEPVPRVSPLSLSEFLAEGHPEESKVVLGWSINTRTLIISLPAAKHSAWSEQLPKILDCCEPGIPPRSSSTCCDSPPSPSALFGSPGLLHRILPYTRTARKSLRSILIKLVKT